MVAINRIHFLIVNNEDRSEEAIKVKELAVSKLGATLAKHKMEEGMCCIYNRCCCLLLFVLYQSFNRFK